MESIAIFFGSLLLLFLLLRLRYGYVQGRLKRGREGGVQHSSLLLPPKDTTTEFLPGSRAGMEDSVEKIKKVMAEGLHIKRLDAEKRRRRHPLAFTTKRDIMRAYIVDAILDKPKWRDPGAG